MSEFTWPWEWDWNWPFAAICGVGLFVLGIVLHLVCFPGIAAIIIGGVVGAFAGTYEWFEL
jgi:hypothetical protein